MLLSTCLLLGPSQLNPALAQEASDVSAMASDAASLLQLETGKPVSPPSGMVAWWTGDGDMVDLVGGLAGTNKNGVVSYKPGLVGNAFYFSGGGYIEIPNAPAINFSGTQSMTMELWAYRTGVDTGMHIITKRVYDLQAEYQLAFDAENGLHFSSIFMPWNVIFTPTHSPLPLTNWCHVAATYDGINMRLYTNGVLAAATLGRLGEPNNEPLRIGAINRDWWPMAYEGLIDELAFYNRALSASEILAIYQANSLGKMKSPPPAPKNPAIAPEGLVGWWSGNGDARDTIKLNHGEAEGRLGYTAGVVDQAFQLNGVDADIIVPASTNLDVGSGAGLTVETWINPTTASSQIPIIEFADSMGTTGVQLWLNGLPLAGSVLSPGSLSANICASQAMTNNHAITSPSNTLFDEQWSHIALTYDRSSGIARLFCNGLLVAEKNLGSFQPFTSLPMNIGYSPAGIYNGVPRIRYSGLIDELSLYNRALSADEIWTLYRASAKGKLKPPASLTGAPLIPASGLVSWWPADGDAKDFVDINNGALRNGAGFTAGASGQALSLRNGAYVEIPNSETLHFTGTHPMTLELWACRFGEATTMHLVGKRNHDLDAEYLMAFNPTDGLCFGGIDMPWSVSQVKTTMQMPLNVWWHLAGTFDGTLLRFYINGQLVASAPGHLGVTNSNPVVIGKIDYIEPMPFEGLIDEVCIYDRALSEEEIGAIFKTGSAGKLKTTTIVDSPKSQMGYWGKNVNFDVTVKGAGLYTYQWFKDGVILPGATNQTFSLDDLKLEDAGNYWVQVATAYGDAFSSSAVLKVNPAGISLGTYAGLLIDGVVGRTYTIQYTTNLKNTNSWTTLTNITLTEPKQLWLDTSTDLRFQPQTNRIYQVKPSQ